MPTNDEKIRIEPLDDAQRTIIGTLSLKERTEALYRAGIEKMQQLSSAASHNQQVEDQARAIFALSCVQSIREKRETEQDEQYVAAVHRFKAQLVQAHLLHALGDLYAQTRPSRRTAAHELLSQLTEWLRRDQFKALVSDHRELLERDDRGIFHWIMQANLFLVQAPVEAELHQLVHWLLIFATNELQTNETNEIEK